MYRTVNLKIHRFMQVKSRWLKMDVRIFCFMIMVNTVYCVNRTKLQTFPPAQKNFDVERFLGYWYSAARLPPCSFEGSHDFTNYVILATLEPGGILNQQHTVRSTACTTFEVTKTPTDIPGVYTAKDSIGNPVSGTSVILATDYKQFVIFWGCVKVVDKVCQDPYLHVATRRKEPDPLTWKIVEAILQHYFEISLTEMIRAIHDENDSFPKSFFTDRSFPNSNAGCRPAFIDMNRGTSGTCWYYVLDRGCIVDSTRYKRSKGAAFERLCRVESTIQTLSDLVFVNL